MTEARPDPARPDAERAEGRSELELPQFKGRPGWEFTDISALNLAAYEPVTHDEELRAAVQSLFDPPDEKPLPEGVIVASLADALERHPDLLASRLGTLVPAGDDVFVSLNDAGFRSGSFVYVP